MDIPFLENINIYDPTAKRGVTAALSREARVALIVRSDTEAIVRHLRRGANDRSWKAPCGAALVGQPPSISATP